MRVAPTDLGRTGTCKGCHRPLTISAENTHLGPPENDARKQAFLLARDGDYEKAVLVLRGEIECRDDQAETWYALAYCYYKTRRLEQARFAARMAKDLGSVEAVELQWRIERAVEPKTAPSREHDRPAPGQTRPDESHETVPKADEHPPDFPDRAKMGPTATQNREIGLKADQLGIEARGRAEVHAARRALEEAREQLGTADAHHQAAHEALEREDRVQAAASASIEGECRRLAEALQQAEGDVRQLESERAAASAGVAKLREEIGRAEAGEEPVEPMETLRLRCAELGNTEHEARRRLAEARTICAPLRHEYERVTAALASGRNEWYPKRRDMRRRIRAAQEDLARFSEAVDTCRAKLDAALTDYGAAVRAAHPQNPELVELVARIDVGPEANDNAGPVVARHTTKRILIALAVLGASALVAAVAWRLVSVS